LLACDARLDNTVEVFRVHRQHSVHVLEIKGNTTERRVDVTLERRSCAERDDRRAMASADEDGSLHIVG
jgi:hypothetical protein